MSFENILAAIFMGLGFLVGLYFYAREAGQKSAELKAERKEAAAASARQHYIEKVRENAKAAEDLGARGNALDSVGMSDDEYKLVFGFDRPHSNS